MKKEKMIFILILLASITLTILSVLCFPQEVKIQFNSNGGTFVKKPIAIIMMFGFTFVFNFLYYTSNERKNLFIALLGLLLHIFIIVVNLFFV